MLIIVLPDRNLYYYMRQTAFRFFAVKDAGWIW